MKKLATLALSALMLSGRALAQDAGQAPEKAPADQYEEMKRSLREQQAQVEKLKQQAKQRDEALRAMQKQVQKQLDDVQAATAAQAAVAQAAPSADATERPGVYKASQEKSAPAPESKTMPIFSPSDPQAAPPPWAVLKIADNVKFRFATVLQPTYEALQDPNSGGYSQNFYLRRARFSIDGSLPEGITVFFQTDDVRVGNAGANGAKNINSGLSPLDAFAQWAFLGKAMALQAGLFVVPTVRHPHTSVSTFLALDLPTWSQQEQSIEEVNGSRDYGVGFNGALFGEHLTYRTGIFSGYRQLPTEQAPPLGPAAGSRNPPRIAGRVMYDFFDTEYSYSYAGTNLGRRKILAIGAGGDGQGAYKGYFGDVFFDWPVFDGAGAVTLEGDYFHYDARPYVYIIGGVPTTLPEQETFYANGGYYFAALHVQPFFRYEVLNYADPINDARNTIRYGGGLNWYVLWQNFKITALYERIIPNVQPPTASIKNLNRFVMQWQGSF
jgi:Phosphate-selective porin O and P